jgi:hypothetical protein
MSCHVVSAFTWVGTPTYICKKCNCKLPLGIIENTSWPFTLRTRSTRLPRPEAAMVAPLALGAATSAPLLLLLLLPLLQNCYAAAASAQVNLVFVLADDLGWNDIGFHDSRVLTPTLDQLAAEGVRLEHHHVYRYCSPTRGSFLSGRLPHHDHQCNPGGQSAFGPDTRMTLLPKRLAAAGYRTAMRGSESTHAAQPATTRRATPVSHSRA